MSVMSNGIYSLQQRKWIRLPQKLDNIIVPDVTTEVDNWKKKIKQAVESCDKEQILNVLNNIYLVRKESLSIEGEYGKGNQIFKELRNSDYLQKLRDAYKKSVSKELSMESLLTEASRTQLLSKTKSSAKGMERFRKRVRSKFATTVKQYNQIDMNKLFKQNILTINISITGETDNYTVKISYGGFLDILRDQLKIQGSKLDLKAVTKSLIIGFNRDDVYIHCSCPDWKYRYAYYATKNQVNSGDAENRPSNITNPKDTLGSSCKHVLLVLSNTSWILKVASTIYNYINYMEKHYKKLYADVIYPAIYGKKYEEPVQLDIDSMDTDELDTDVDTIDKSNQYAADKNKFKVGNTQGIRFASNQDKDQISIDTDQTGTDTNQNNQ